MWTKIPSRYQETVFLIVLNLYESLYTPILFWVKIFVIFNSRNWFWLPAIQRCWRRCGKRNRPVWLKVLCAKIRGPRKLKKSETGFPLLLLLKMYLLFICVCMSVHACVLRSSHVEVRGQHGKKSVFSYLQVSSRNGTWVPRPVLQVPSPAGTSSVISTHF